MHRLSRAKNAGAVPKVVRSLEHACFAPRVRVFSSFSSALQQTAAQGGQHNTGRRAFTGQLGSTRQRHRHSSFINSSVRRRPRSYTPQTHPYPYRRFATMAEPVHSRSVERLAENMEKPLLDNRSYRVIKLPNQLEALLIHDPDTDKASAAMDVNVGSFSDAEDMPGMAHAVEHLLFMGTEKVSDALIPRWKDVAPDICCEHSTPERTTITSTSQNSVVVQMPSLRLRPRTTTSSSPPPLLRTVQLRRSQAKRVCLYTKIRRRCTERWIVSPNSLSDRYS